MPRNQPSRKHQSLSFTKFVARLQRTFSTKVIKSSTRITVQHPKYRLESPYPSIRFPANSTENTPHCPLSALLYDPSRQVEYLSDIDESDDLDLSDPSQLPDEGDSCYDSMSDHRQTRNNLSRMNVSMDEWQQYSKSIQVKLPSGPNRERFHSTAIYDMSRS